MERRLAAILSADVVGYSRLMGLDEEGTFARIRGYRKELFEPEIASRHGRIFKLMGDGLLAEFTSAVEAVECAIKLQAAMRERNVGLPDDQRIDVRIGVNLGDVIIEDADRHGDSINLAARLQQLAPPGGVCISDKVMAEVARKVGASFENGGERVLKNIKQPVQVYFWHPDKPTSKAVGAGGSASTGGKPSLVLLPLEPLAPDEQTRTLAVGVNEAVASSIANLTGIELLTAVEAAKYRALGSVQTSGSRYRVTVKLVDRLADKQFWSERFDGNMATIFDTLDELALRICSALRYEIYERETERSRVRPVEEQTNEQLMGRAGHILLNSKRTDYERSVELIDIVLGRDPENFMALAIRAWGSMVEVVCGYREVSPTDAKMRCNCPVGRSNSTSEATSPIWSTDSSSFT
jgi:class 3 adenylate cyclase/TolB-like protein